MNRNKRGYSVHTQNKTYCVEIQKYGKRIRINGIKTESEAKEIREKLEKEVFGEYAIDRSINATSNT
jgi:ArsR family metal-binding transcriptional regulator